MAKRPRKLSVDKLPAHVLERIKRDAIVQAAALRIAPDRPADSVRALGIIAAAYGLRGEVDEHALTIRIDSDDDSVPTPFAAARDTMKRVFLDDAEPNGMLDVYIANVAMLLHDRFRDLDFRSHWARNNAAAAIMDLVFGLSEKEGGD